MLASKLGRLRMHIRYYSTSTPGKVITTASRESPKSVKWSLRIKTNNVFVDRPVKNLLGKGSWLGNVLSGFISVPKGNPNFLAEEVKADLPLDEFNRASSSREQFIRIFDNYPYRMKADMKIFGDDQGYKGTGELYVGSTPLKTQKPGSKDEEQEIIELPGRALEGDLKVEYPNTQDIIVIKTELRAVAGVAQEATLQLINQAREKFGKLLYGQQYKVKPLPNTTQETIKLYADTLAKIFYPEIRLTITMDKVKMSIKDIKIAHTIFPSYIVMVDELDNEGRIIKNWLGSHKTNDTVWGLAARWINGLKLTELLTEEKNLIPFPSSQKQEPPKSNLSLNKNLALFPQSDSEFNYTLSNEPMFLNGMKVIFDQPVGVYPVTLESKNKEHSNGTPNKSGRSRRSDGN